MRAKTLTIYGITMCMFFITSFTMKTFAITATVRCNIPSAIKEASGVDYNGSDFWTHNDGGSNKIYRFNSSGSLRQTLEISGATNRDWEDITHSSDGSSMFIGDFGNNNFDRTNLKIYKFPYPSSSSTIRTASSINFSYPDQRQFPSKWKNFDAEAFFHYDGKLYIFTKGEGSAIGYTKMYSVPDSPGTYSAKLVDSFYVNSRITGAAISPDAKSVTLISNTKIYLFKNYSGTDFFGGQCTKISISGSWTQKEGVTYSSSSNLYIVDEGSPGKLYSVNISSYFSQAARMESPDEPAEAIDTKFNFSAFPNPANSHVIIQTEEKFENVEILIMNLSGQIIQHEIFVNPDEKIRIETEALKPGIYVVRMLGDNRKDLSLRLSITH